MHASHAVLLAAKLQLKLLASVRTSVRVHNWIEQHLVLQQPVGMMPHPLALHCQQPGGVVSVKI